MKTILYNSATETIIGTYANGYKVDGHLKIVDPPIYELQLIDSEAPVITGNQVLSSEWVVDLKAKTYTLIYTIRDKTEVELIAEKEAQAQTAEAELNAEEVKKLLRLTADTLPEADLYQYPTVYPAWKPNISISVGEKYQYNSKLYKVVQGHTTQLNWTPDIVPALFTVFNPPDVIPEWKQPLGSQDAYVLEAKVTHNGFTWESTVNTNVWEPGVYGWVQI